MNLIARMALVALLLGCFSVAYFATRSGEVTSTTSAQNSPPSESLPQLTPPSLPAESATDMVQAKGPSPSAPMAPAAQGSRKDLLDANLAQLFQQALEAKNPDDRALAFWVGSHCSGFAFGEANAQVSEKDLMTSYGFQANQAKKMMERRSAARNQMKRLCSTGDADDFFEALRKHSKPGSTLTGIMSRIELPNNADALYRQQHVQALTQLLASPGQYPAQFDRWLDSPGFSTAAKRIGAPSGAVSFIGDALLARFGLEHMLNYRATQKCLGFLRCFNVNELPEAQRAAVEAAADQLEMLIRTQRWDIFLPQGG